MTQDLEPLERLDKLEKDIERITAMMVDSEINKRQLNYRTSPELNELFTALAKAQGIIQGAIKDKDNPYWNSKYADLAGVWEACRKPLTDNGLCVTQLPQYKNKAELRGQYGGALHQIYDSIKAITTNTPEQNEVKTALLKKIGKLLGMLNDSVVVTTIIGHTSGQWIANDLEMMLEDPNPQKIGIVITYARRYSLSAIAGVPQEDDDAEGAMGRNGGKNGVSQNGKKTPTIEVQKTIAHFWDRTRNTLKLEDKLVCEELEIANPDDFTDLVLKQKNQVEWIKNQYAILSEKYPIKKTKASNG